MFSHSPLLCEFALEKSFSHFCVTWGYFIKPYLCSAKYGWRMRFLFSVTYLKKAMHSYKIIKVKLKIKLKKMKKFYLIAGMVLSIMTAGVFTACSESEDDRMDFQLLKKQEKQKSSLNEETSAFKSCLVSTLKQTRTRSVNENFTFTEEQLGILKEKSLAMFESHGFTEKDVMDLVENDDERLIFVATVFTAIVESPSMPTVKTRAVEGDNGECFYIEKVKECLKRLIDITEITDFLTGCLTKTALFSTLAKFIPYAGYAFAAADFANCMGWLDWW